MLEVGKFYEYMGESNVTGMDGFSFGDVVYVAGKSFEVGGASIIANHRTIGGTHFIEPHAADRFVPVTPSEYEIAQITSKMRSRIMPWEQQCYEWKNL